MTCPVCHQGAREIPVARHYMREPLYVCDGCGLVHADRKPTGTWDSWPENYHPSWPASRARLVYVAEFLDQHGLMDDIFDISEGDGFFLRQCRMRGAKAEGMNEPFETANKRRYKVVCINWTLENTSDPVGMLRWARDHGEYVCIAMGSRILVPFKKPLWAYLDDSPSYLHPNHFSFGTLRSTMGQAELTPHKVNRYLDTDHLVVIGVTGESWWTGDNPKEVIRYFERWHEDTKCYAKG